MTGYVLAKADKLQKTVMLGKPGFAVELQSHLII